VSVATLTRVAYLSTVTLGFLDLGGRLIPTLERPWIPNPHGRGGLPRESCIPDGEYRLEPFDGTRFRNVYRLSNHSLGVYEATRPIGQTWGRTAILFHAGNSVDDVIGCIAVGMAHSVNGGRNVLVRSGEAVNILRAQWGASPPRLLIRPTMGTQGVV
jgi:hypothetical protein